MLRKAVFAIVAVLVAGCSGSGSAIESGSRLRARWEVAAGARRLVGWHDQTLGLDCEFERYVAGRQHRCLPHVALMAPFYADAACTEQLAVNDAALPGEHDTTPHYVMVRPDNACVANPTFFEIGAPADSSSVFTNSSGTCMPMLGPPELYRVGAAVAETTFVGAVEQPMEGQLLLHAEDGAGVPWGGWDGTRAVLPTSAGDTSVSWAPWIVAYQRNDRFADAACSVPLAAKGAADARCPMDAVLSFIPSPMGHITGVAFSALGAPVTSTYGRDSNSGACMATSDSGEIAFQIGASIPNEQLRTAGDTLEGTGSVQVHHATLDGHAIWNTAKNSQWGGNGPPRPDYFVDAATGLQCDPLPGADGALRCIPQPMVAGEIYFADAACSQPVVAIVGTLPPPSLITSAAGDGRFHGWPVQGQVTPAQLFSFGSGSCTPVSPVPGGFVFYGTGAEFPPDRFAEVTTVVD
jgi:hypothetical protein